MAIRLAELRTKILRAGGDASTGGAFQTLQRQSEPYDWLVLVDLGPGRYGVLGMLDLSDDLRTRLQAAPDLPLREVAVPSPLGDAEDDTIATLRQRGSQTGYVVVMREGEPLGIVQLKRARAGVLGLESTPGLPAATEGGTRPMPIRTDRYVNTDFAAVAIPTQRLGTSTLMEPGQQYCFRLNIGELEAGSIEQQPSVLQAELLNQEIDLDVVIFSEDFTLTADKGRIRVPTQGATSVVAAASLPADLTLESSDGRLFFLVTAPDRLGIATLRCNLYVRGFLIQSRLVRAAIGANQALDETGTLRRSVLEFNLSGSLIPGLLAGVEDHRLSVMVNSDGSGTHSFRLVGQDGGQLFANSATLPAPQLADLIELSRKRLRQVAWGSETEFDGSGSYRYAPAQSPEALLGLLKDDLIRMAVRGATLYTTVVIDLAGGGMAVRNLRTMMKKPGLVQLASKLSANDIVPIALFYDYPVNEQADSLCPAFLESLASGRQLIDEPCFNGDCPSWGNQKVVCPSGFWGFRHEIGMPFPVLPNSPELATSIPYSGTPMLDIGYYSSFALVKDHLAKLSSLNYQVSSASPACDLFTLLRGTKPQVIYFYCHGRESGGIPLLEVGADGTNDFISSPNIFNEEINWPDQRPLVFINGCHTAALTPSKAISMVRAWLEYTSASGVIGTEITIFEPLATSFAESFLQIFQAGVPLGRAIRMARLQLLAQRNPLGLVYLPQAYAGLRLTPSA